MFRAKSCASPVAAGEKGAAFLFTLNADHFLPIKNVFEQAVVDESFFPDIQDGDFILFDEQAQSVFANEASRGDLANGKHADFVFFGHFLVLSVHSFVLPCITIVPR